MSLDPLDRRIHWLVLEADREYRPLERTGALRLTPAELAAQLKWSCVAGRPDQPPRDVRR
jgi:hypothetical protein